MWTIGNAECSPAKIHGVSTKSPWSPRGVWERVGECEVLAFSLPEKIVLRFGKFLFKFMPVKCLKNIFCLFSALVPLVRKSGFGLSDLIRPYKVIIHLPACKLFFQQE